MGGVLTVKRLDEISITYLYVITAEQEPANWNLQLFSAEDEGRTEPATPRRIRQEREKGHAFFTVWFRTNDSVESYA